MIDLKAHGSDLAARSTVPSILLSLTGNRASTRGNLPNAFFLPCGGNQEPARSMSTLKPEDLGVPETSSLHLWLIKTQREQASARRSRKPLLDCVSRAVSNEVA